jgi:hypothetical protein
MVTYICYFKSLTTTVVCEPLYTHFTEEKMETQRLGDLLMAKSQVSKSQDLRLSVVGSEA